MNSHLCVQSFIGQKNSQPQTSSLADTNTLITTVLCGKGIKQVRSMSESPTQPNIQAQQQQPKLPGTVYNNDYVLRPFQEYCTYI